VKPESDRRLSDLVSVGLLTRVFPPELVDEVIEQAGRTQRRRRSLPARTMAYFAVGMALYSEGSYEDVMAQLTDGLSWSTGWGQEYVPPSKSGIFQARARLGAEPVEALFRRVAEPLAASDTPGSWLAGRRLVAIDGTCLDVADTPENDAFFGRAGVTKGERAAFPLARVVAVAECGTHAIFDAEVGPYTTSEGALAGKLVERLEPGMLMLADRGLAGLGLWRRAAATGADLLWRFRNGTNALTPHPVRELPDGSYLAQIVPSGPARKAGTEPITVRVIDYTVDDGRENPETYRLLTTITDPSQAPAEELAAAYSHLGDRECLRRAQDAPTRATDRAALEVTRPGAPRDLGPPVLPLRDPDPDGRHRRGRRPRPRPGLLRRRPPDRPPLGRPPGRFSPLTSLALRRCGMHAIKQLLARLNPQRRARANPRVVKRKMTRWNVKRSHHASWPQPTAPPAVTVQPP
jgi:hypothetical protein